MLYVSEIVPINHYQKRVVISDTASDFTAEMTYGEYVTDEFIKRMAPSTIGRADKTKRRRK